LDVRVDRELAKQRQRPAGDVFAVRDFDRKLQRDRTDDLAIEESEKRIACVKALSCHAWALMRCDEVKAQIGVAPVRAMD
jgi:hypothetical protein